MTPVHFGPGELAWLDPETEEERQWLEGVPGEWTLDRVWNEWKKVVDRGD